MLALVLAPLLLFQSPAVSVSMTKDAGGIEDWVVQPDPAGFPRFFREFERLTNHLLADPNDLPFARSVAVLVGVSRYPHAEIEDLDFVREDITRMRNYLLDRGAFDRVIVLLDDAATNQEPKSIVSPACAAIDTPIGLTEVAVSQSAEEAARLAIPQNIR